LHRFCLIHPCDRQTDGQTDGRTELRWLRRAIAVPAVARKKGAVIYGADALSLLHVLSFIGLSSTNVHV